MGTINSVPMKKDSFYVVLKRISFRWDSKPRSMDYEANSLITTSELSDSLMFGHKSSISAILTNWDQLVIFMVFDPVNLTIGV